MIKCPECGMENSDDAEFCIECNTRLIYKGPYTPLKKLPARLKGLDTKQKTVLAVSIGFLIIGVAVLFCSVPHPKKTPIKKPLSRTPGIERTAGPEADTLVTLPTLREPEVLWRVEIGESDNPSSPAPGEGVLFVTSGENLYAFKSDTGREIWQLNRGADTTWRTPVVGNGILYVVDGVKNILYALNGRTGRGVWWFRGSGLELTDPATSDGMVYVGGMNYLIALDEKSGDERWRFEAGGEISSPPVSINGLLFFVSSDNYLYALNGRMGKELWRFGLKDLALFPPAVTDSRGDIIVYVGSGYRTEDFSLYAIDGRTGDEIWRIDTINNRPQVPVVSGEGDRLFVGLLHYLNILDPFTYEELVRLDTGAWISPPVISGGVVYIGTAGDYLFAIDIDSGEMIWRFFGFQSGTAPVVIEDVVYFVSVDGFIYAVK